MKLYTEYHLKEVYFKGLDNGKNHIEGKCHDAIDSQTPIQLPSDEEIGEKANLLQNEEYSSTYNEGINEGFYLGVEYMQQILNQNK